MIGAIVRRSYPTGSQNLIHLVQQQSYELEVVFQPGAQLPVEVVIDFERRCDDWSSKTALTSRDHTFVGKMTATAAGLLRAKARYRHADGPWIWDSAPYAYFIVDPIHVGSVRLYTFYPGCNGTIREDWIRMLPRIQDMGYNTIHLLPLTEMGPSQSPYSASDPFRIDPAYSLAQDPESRMDEFRDFVAACKERGIRLCIDLVMNHVAVKSVITNEHPDWLAEDPSESDGIKRSGWHDGHRWHKWKDLAFLNYIGFCERRRNELWKYMTEYALMWSSFAAETGGMIRLDNLHSSTPEFIRHVLQGIRKSYPDIVVFAELFAIPEETIHLTFEYGINLLLATTWEHKFVPQLRRYLGFIHSGSPSLRYLAPVTSHDSGTPAQEFGSVASTLPRIVMATLMSPGPSGIVQGVEMGLAEKLPLVGKPQKRSFKVIRDFTDIIRTLNGLLDKLEFLSRPGNMRFIDGDHQAVLGVLREDAGGSLLVCANFDTANTQQIELPAEVISRVANRGLKNELDGIEIDTCLNATVLTLPPARCIATILS